jgi:hypothetical protein
MMAEGRRGRVAIASALCAALVACSKSNEPTPTGSLRMMPGAPAPPPPEDTATAAPKPFVPTHDPIEYDGAPLTYIATVTLEGSAAKVDPDLAIVEAARASASSCFAGLGGPDVRSAVIRVTVVPGGSVSRTEVSSDPDVADCLRRVGDGLHFSAQDEKPGKGGTDNGGAGIRSFSIDVSVTRNH